MEIKAGDVVVLKSDSTLTSKKKFTVGSVYASTTGNQTLALVFWFDYITQDIKKMEIFTDVLEKK